MAEEVDAVRGVIRLGKGGDVVVVAGVDEGVAGVPPPASTARQASTSRRIDEART